MDFKQFLNNKKCFKLICGAGNQNYDEITKLCAIYSKAGCRFFDVNPSSEALRSAKLGCKIAGIDDAYFCVSIGIDDDPHFQKAKINQNCKNCKRCINACFQNAIYEDKNGQILIDEKKCIGCKRCINCCQHSAITMYSIDNKHLKLLPDLINEGIDCIEIHTVSYDEELVKRTISDVADLYNGPISICLDRTKFGDESSIRQLKFAKSVVKDILLVQADGAPMSGGEDDYRTTLQAVAMADIVLKNDISEYIFVSGGTNSKTMELANLLNLNITGVGVGSFARKIVRDILNSEKPFDINHLQPKIYSKVVNLVQSVYK